MVMRRHVTLNRHLTLMGCPQDTSSAQDFQIVPAEHQFLTRQWRQHDVLLRYHPVINRGAEPRIHFIFDYAPAQTQS